MNDPALLTHTLFMLEQYHSGLASAIYRLAESVLFHAASKASGVFWFRRFRDGPFQTIYQQLGCFFLLVFTVFSDVFQECVEDLLWGHVEGGVQDRGKGAIVFLGLQMVEAGRIHAPDELVDEPVLVS